MLYVYMKKQVLGTDSDCFFIIRCVRQDMAVYMKRQPPRQLQQSRPPMGNGNRTIELSTVPVRAHCPSGGGGRIPFGSASRTLYLLCLSAEPSTVIRSGPEDRTGWLLGAV